MGVRPLWIEDGFGVVEDDEHLPGREEGFQGRQIIGVVDPCTDDLGESGKEMKSGSWELIATNESTVVPESFDNTIMVEDCERN